MSPKVEKWHPTPTFWVATAALVIATVALIAAVSGVATASQKIIVRKGDIAPGAVTAKSIAGGAVTARKIRMGAVTSAKLANRSVSAQAISPDAVTATAIAPGSVYGGALGTETLVTKPIKDLDAIPHNGEWTPSNSEAALCNAGETLLGTGFAMTNAGNGEASWLEAMPVINAETRGVLGRISTDSGGTASGQIVAICLK